MLSPQPKVLHQIGGKSMLAHVLAAIRTAAGQTHTAIVVASENNQVAAEASRIMPNAEIYVQAERRGTAHAVLAAKPALARGADDILIIFGDTPLVRPQTLSQLRAT